MTNQDTDRYKGSFTHIPSKQVKVVGDEVWYDGLHVANIRSEQLPSTVVNSFKDFLAGEGEG